MQLVIIGAGGHGKVVLDIVRAAGKYEASLTSTATRPFTARPSAACRCWGT